jgi:hypothetical protein
VERGQPLLTREGFLIGRKKQRVTGAAQKFSVWQTTGCVSGTVADLQNFPGSIGGSGPNGQTLDLAAPDMNDQMATFSEDTVAAATYRTAFMPFFKRIRSTPLFPWFLFWQNPLILVSLHFSFSFLARLAELDPLPDQSPPSCLR